MKRWLLFAFLILASCEEDRSAGTGSQTGNSVVAGRILRLDSLPAADVEVSLTPATWDRAVSLVQRTDSLGRYRFDEVESGLWILQSRGQLAALVRNLRLMPGRDSVLPALIALPRGVVVVEVHLDDTLRKGRLVVMGGEESRSLATTSREIFLRYPDLAPGTHWFSIVGPDGKHLREASFVARSGRTDTLKDVLWKREGVAATEDGVYDPDHDGDDDAEDD
ncbi:MAG TPA: hypothetical protein PKY05_06565 [Fibrobacteria bacterium]|nr:hypothetical protein [Fibrobacteria bacterium]